MAESMQNRALSGVKWTTIHFVGRFIISFILSIILAHLLEPEEFGITGMLTVFITLSAAFVESGFGQTLVRMKDLTDVDFSTVFYFNILVSIFFYIVLYFCAPYISGFFNVPILIPVTRLLSLVFLINSFGIVQTAHLVREVNYRTQTICILIGLLVSAAVSSCMALNGYGVYSIVGQVLSQALTTNVLLWATSKWRPLFVFSKSSFIRLWKFSSKVLATSVISQVIDQIDSFVIGKLFYPYLLGIYTRGKSLSQMPETIFTGVLGAVSFSILSKVNDDRSEVIRLHIKFFKLTLFLLLPLIAGLIASSDALIISLYSSKWAEAIPILQIVAVAVIPQVIGTLYSQTIMALGDANLFFKLITLKRILGLLAIPFGFYYGLYPFIIALTSIKLLSLIIDFYYMSKLLDLPHSRYYILLIKPSIIAALMGACVYLIGYILEIPFFLKLITQLITGLLLYIALSQWFNKEEFVYLRETIEDRIKGRKKRNT